MLMQALDCLGPDDVLLLELGYIGSTSDSSKVQAMTHLMIDPMSPAELDVVINWAAQEGWNPGLHDAVAFRAADPDGFLMARQDGEPVASISAVRYGQDFGFIGLYIVEPSYRGRGFGWATWQAGMAHLRGRSIGLDGVISQQDNYRKSGFTLHHRNIRYQGYGAPASATLYPAGTHVLPLVDLSFEHLQTFDKTFFPSGRSTFLAAWISQPGSRGLALLKHDALSGYGVIRPCHTGFKIGPLFATTEADAECLLLALCSHVAADQPIFLDVPECNPAACRLAQRHAMQPMFETARMYTGTPPDMALEHTFGITTFELG